MKKTVSIILSVFVLALAVLPCVSAGAVEGEKTPSLSLRFIAEGIPMDNVSFSAWKIAEPDAEGKMQSKKPFDIKDISDKTPEQLAQLSKELETFVSENGIAADDTAVTDEQGKLRFEKIDSAGMYLVLGDSKTVEQDVYSPTPFIISLPYTDEYGRLIYEVEADVKYEKSTVPPTEPTTEPTTEPSTETTTESSTEPTTAVTTVPPTTPPGNNIPQTGTMLWLVPVLLIAGAVLVAAGIIIKKKISK